MTAKVYYIQNNIGKSKYVLNYHNGSKLHTDGSQFFDIKIFKSKSELGRFVRLLKSLGYTER